MHPFCWTSWKPSSFHPWMCAMAKQRLLMTVSVTDIVWRSTDSIRAKSASVYRIVCSWQEKKWGKMERKERVELTEKPSLFIRIAVLGLETFKCVKMDNFQLVHPIQEKQTPFNPPPTVISPWHDDSIALGHWSAIIAPQCLVQGKRLGLSLAQRLYFALETGFFLSFSFIWNIEDRPTCTYIKYTICDKVSNGE